MMPQSIQIKISDILTECGFRENPYFGALSRGDFELEDFVETQIQFSHAVSYFSRPMAVLAAKIPVDELRAKILHNIWEEHGEGDLSRSHGATFRAFLSRLAGVTDADIERRALWPEVRLFNTVLAGACVADDYLLGAAMMGMIERMFCEISSIIGNGVVQRGWIPAQSMIHYDLHSELDVRHAQEFFDVVEGPWNESAESRELIEQGLRLGSTVFGGLYESLYRKRTRRLFKP